MWLYLPNYQSRVIYSFLGGYISRVWVRQIVDKMWSFWADKYDQIRVIVNYDERLLLEQFSMVNCHRFASLTSCRVVLPCRGVNLLLQQVRPDGM